MTHEDILTALNCSIGQLSLRAGLDAAHAAGFDRVELWWPFAYPDPTPDEVEEFCSELQRRGLTLVALNLFGGDLADGERGVLHERDVPAGHLDAVTRCHEITGVRRFNVLLGRGGRELLPAQADRFAAIAHELHQRFEGVAMVEPLSGLDDYPVGTIAGGLGAIREAGAGGLLLDLYHVAANAAQSLGGESIPTAADIALELACAAIGEVAHVQVADFPHRGAPGTGGLPLAQWVHQLRAAGYAGEVAGEWLPA